MTSYNSHVAINNSSLSYLDLEKGGSPQKFKDYLEGKIASEDTKYYREGSLIHLALLEPEKLIKAEITRPVESIVGVVDKVFEVVTSELDEFSEVGALEDYKEVVLKVINEVGYQTNWKEETRVGKVLEQGTEYFEFLKRCTKEIVLTPEEHSKILSCAASVRTDRFAKELMLDEFLEEGETADNELELYFDSVIGGTMLRMKAKLDRVIYNHKKKTYRIIDLKTTGKSVLDFPKTFFDFDYDRQIAFYTLAMNNVSPDYRMESCSIVTVEKFGEFRTRVFKVDPSSIELGGRKIYKLLSMYVTALSSGDFSYEPGYKKPYTIIPTRETVRFNNYAKQFYFEEHLTNDLLVDADLEQEVNNG